MRVLHVIGWLAPRYGGPAGWVPQLSVEVAKRGHEVEIITTNADGSGVLDVPVGRAVDWAGAIATFHPLSAPRRYLTSWPMLAELRHRVPTFDVVHIHSLYRFHTIAAAAIARRWRVPYVIQAHGALDPWHRRRRRRAKNIYHYLVEDPIIRGAAAVVCTSRREEQSIRDLGYRAPTWVIPGAIDGRALREPAPANLLSYTGIDFEAVRVVTFLGRISAKKGVPLLVESFVLTAAAFPDAHLIVAGPDDEGIGRGLAPTIAKAGLTDRVSFIGVVTGPEKASLLQHSDVFVLPSADESFGSAVAEAMAVGCPVVVSPDVAIENVVRASAAGVVAERNAADLARAVGTILADSGVARAMGEAGRRVVDAEFAWPRIVSEVEAMYEAVIATSRGRSKRSGADLSRLDAGGPLALAFACPVCRGTVRPEADAYACSMCGRVYPMVDGIPILLPDRTLAEHDDMDHFQHDHEGNGSGEAHKAGQAAHFDAAAHEAFEIDRPHGSPRFYRFLLDEKLRRAVDPIRPHLYGASALIVCGGSGMEAEFLVRAGVTVITSDLSLGAATRAKARSDKRRLAIDSVVADVEHLPYADQSVDLVVVHDGLHHLGDPNAGLLEMARVARRWVVVAEPARASITRLAIRLGLALETEEAGNWVARMDPTEVGDILEAHGYVVLRAERYAMFYRHHPAAVVRLLSRPLVFPIARMGWRLVNALLGRWGNKMVVVAERRDQAE